MAERTMTGEVRMRVPLPLAIPLGALIVIAVLTIGMSRVLLAVEPEVAVIIALVTAANILGAAAVIAMRPGLSTAAIIELTAVVLYPLIIGVAVSQIAFGEEAEGGHAAEAAAGGATTSVTAETTQFNTDEITLTAGEETELKFINNDTVDHNISILEGEGGKKLFKGKLIADSSTTYKIPALDKGEYYFQCDVHPSMKGTVVVE